MRTFTHDAFLSHNQKDKKRVRRLAEQLRDRGVKVWFDEWEIQPGDDIFLAIEGASEIPARSSSASPHPRSDRIG